MLPSIRAGTPKASSTLRAEVAYSPGLLVADRPVSEDGPVMPLAVRSRREAVVLPDHM